VFDLIIRGGTVIDGSGRLGRKADIGIRDDTITAITPQLTGAHQTIDATGKVVCPGFIDMHAHSGLVVFEQPDMLPKICQGVTTEVIGVDGISVAPVTREGLTERQRYVAALDGQITIDWPWCTFPEYLNHLELLNPATNLVPLIPHGAVRDVIMGLNDQMATQAEISHMGTLVTEGFESGAFGLSFGLIYMPGAYAHQGELAALIDVAARYDRLVTVHVRNEADMVVESVEEMAQFAARSGARMHISHLKIVGKQNQHLLPALLDTFASHNRAGIPLSFDQYPYIAGNTQLAVLIPPWAHVGGPSALLHRLSRRETRQKIHADMMEDDISGWENLYCSCGWENIIVSSVASEQNKCFIGCSIYDLACQLAKDPFEVVFDLLLEENLDVGMIDFYGDETSMQSILKSEFQSVGTDGIFSNKHPHPRLYGTYPRILGCYVRDKGLLSLPEAICKMTSRPADLLGLADRGRLQEGYKADLVVFDPTTIIDRATYRRPKVYPIGIEWVIVNGAITLNNSTISPQRNGYLLRSETT
jgi:N-acyl-D-amino-acid deacylase